MKNIRQYFVRDGKHCADCNAYFSPDKVPNKMTKFGDNLVCIPCTILRINAEKTLRSQQ